MRIGICCYPSHGGSGVVATELGKHLADRGHEVAFISYSAPLRLTELPSRVSFHEVEIEQYPLLKYFPYTLALASKLAEVVETKDLDILHAGSQGCTHIAWNRYHLGREQRFVQTCHQNDH